MKLKLEDWLVGCFRVALLGEIYPEIRAIAVSFNENRVLLIRYYLDRIPVEFDNESIEVVATNLDATMPEGTLHHINVECIFFDDVVNQMDALDGFVYARREYEMNS